MKLDDWAKEYGVERVAGALGVHISTVYRWIAGDITPSDRQKLAINRLSRGRVRVLDMVEMGAK